MTLRREIGSVLAVTTVGVALAASPASAETYEVTCTFQGLPLSFDFDITAAGPDETIPAGATFTLTDLTVVREIDATVDHSLEVTLLGETVDLGRVGPSGEDIYTWGPMDVELTAPSVEGVVDVGIAPESAVQTQHTANDVEFVCDEFPDLPFASVTVEGDEPPATTTTTTTTTTPPGDPGDGGLDGDGGPDGDPADDGDGGSDGEGSIGAEATAPAAVPVTGRPSFTG